MKKKDIVKLVFVVILTLIAVYCCIMSGVLRDSTDHVGDNTENAGEAIGAAFAAIFLVLFNFLSMGIGVIASAISILISSFGVRSGQKPARIVFWCFLAVNVILIILSVLFMFAGR